MRTLTSWTIEPRGKQALAIETADPRTAWILELSPNTLRISCTSCAEVVSAQAPAPRDRIVACTLDPRGVPLNWVGTNEVKDKCPSHSDPPGDGPCPVDRAVAAHQRRLFTSGLVLGRFRQGVARVFSDGTGRRLHTLVLCP